MNSTFDLKNMEAISHQIQKHLEEDQKSSIYWISTLGLESEWPDTFNRFIGFYIEDGLNEGCKVSVMNSPYAKPQQTLLVAKFLNTREGFTGAERIKEWLIANDLYH